MKSGGIMTCRISTEDTIAVESFKDFPQMGRFTLRDEGAPGLRCALVPSLTWLLTPLRTVAGKTIGIGKILRIKDYNKDKGAWLSA